MATATCKIQDTRGRKLAAKSSQVFARQVPPLLLLLLLATAGVAAGPSSSAKADEKNHQRAEDKLGHLCRRIANIKRISEMQELIEHLRQVVVSKRDLDGAYPGTILSATSQFTTTLMSTLTGSYSAPMRFFNQNPAAPCLAQVEALLSLGEFVGERTSVCTSAHLDKMERYYARYLSSYFAYSEQVKRRAPTYTRSASMRVTPSAAGPAVPSKPITAKFFQLYASQVSFKCKSNLLHSLNAIDENKLVTRDDYDKVMPWLTDEANTSTCERVESLMESQLVAATSAVNSQRLAASQDHNLDSMRAPSGESLAKAAQALGVTREEFRRCNARKLLTDLSHIDELVEVLDSSESFVELEATDEPPRSASSLFLVVPEGQKEVVANMMATCAKLRPIYERTVLPIVRLARLGFNPAHENFDKVCSSDQLIKRWFGLTLVCDSMLGSQMPSDLDKYRDLIRDNNSKESFVVVDEDDGHSKDPSGTAAYEPVDEELLSELTASPIDDELWIHKYGTTKLQRFKDSVIKRVFKLFKVEDINSHIVFRKHIADTSQWIMRIVLITLTLACSRLR